jgi:hypothetical protein
MTDSATSDVGEIVSAARATEMLRRAILRSAA